MTVKDLIKDLLEYPMDQEVMLGTDASDYNTELDGVDPGLIWRDNKEEEVVIIHMAKRAEAWECVTDALIERLAKEE